MTTPARGSQIGFSDIYANFTGGNLDAGWNVAYNVYLYNQSWYGSRTYYSGYYGNRTFPAATAGSNFDWYTYMTAASGNCNCCCNCCCNCGTGCCFDPNARVLMKDGSWKKISMIAVGDEVVGFNGTMNRVTGTKSTTVGDRKMIKFVDYNFYATDDHLFLTENGWKTWRPDRLVDNNRDNLVLLSDENRQTPLSGDDVMILTEGKISYADLKVEEQAFNSDFVVYDLHLDGDNTYTVESFVVHNCGDGGTGGDGGGGDGGGSG
jgi:hypothetical protein